MEVQFGGFQKAVFEVVEVEQHAVLVKLWLRVTLAEVQSFGTSYLHVGQLTYGVDQQFLFLHIVSAASLTPAVECSEE